MSRQEQTENWLLHDKDRDNMQIAESRSEAEDRKAKMEELGADVTTHQPGEHPNTQTASDGGTNGEVAETMEHPATEETNHSEDPAPVETPATETSDTTTEVVEEIPDDPPMDENPVNWIPGDFVDSIEGEDVINRMGYEVLCRHFGISVRTHMVESPSENGFDHCIHQATAVTDDGTEYTAYGSAHVDRGDDKELLVEMSDTRAYKRAASRATGTGMLAAEEMQNEL